jgi:hypothetical protein
VKFLTGNGAKVDIWNRKNSSGWTPLRIAAGVHRGMNLRFHEPTADALRAVMTAAGVSTALEPEKLSAEQRQRNKSSTVPSRSELFVCAAAPR